MKRHTIIAPAARGRPYTMAEGCMEKGALCASMAEKDADIRARRKNMTRTLAINKAFLMGLLLKRSLVRISEI